MILDIRQENLLPIVKTSCLKIKTSLYFPMLNYQNKYRPFSINVTKRITIFYEYTYYA